MNGSRISVSACLCALLLAPAALAQPVERPESGALQRTDLSGDWRVPAQSGPKGSVVFSGRKVATDGDTYSVRFDLPNGTSRTLQGTFDGTRLTLTKEAEAPADAAAASDGVETRRRGISDTLEGERGVDGDDTPEGETPPAASDDQAADAEETGIYVLSRSKLSRGFMRRKVPMMTFKAQGAVDADGPTPVAKFGRANLAVTIVRTDGEGTNLLPGSRAKFKLVVLPSNPGDVTWSCDSDAVKLSPRGKKVRVEGKTGGKVTLKATFASKVGSNHEAEIVLTVRPPIETVKVVAVTFNSDHGLLKDNATTWSDGGKTFPEPEWTPAAQHPITHTMGESIRVTVKLDVGPANAVPQKGVLRGTGPEGLKFEQEVSLKPGAVTVTLDSGRTKLAEKIQKLDLALSWSLADVGSLGELTTTHTTAYVTMDTPSTPGRNPGVTLKRMSKAVEATSAAASLDPRKVVKKVISTWNHYNLQVAYPNAWELGEDRKDPTTGKLIGADCQTIVRFTQNVIAMVGSPGKAEYVVVWAKVKTPEKGEESLNARNHMTSPMQWYNDHNATDSKRTRWIAALVDGGGGLNNYEAALRFTYKGKHYYPGGVNAVFNNPNEVIKVFTTMSWVDLNDLKAGPKEHIHRYR